MFTRIQILSATVVVLIAVAVVLVLDVGRAREDGAAAGADAGPVRLGMLVPLTGAEKESAAALVRGAQMAVDEANASGGVLGRRVELVTEDAGCDAETAVLGAQRLLRRDIVAHVGGYCSSGTLPALPSLHDADIPTVTPASNSDALLEPGFDDLFLMMPTGTQEARFAVDLMREQGARRVAIVHDGSSYSANIATVAAAAAGEAPEQFESVHTAVIASGADSYAALAADAAVRSAEVVYFTGYYPEASKIVVDLRRAGFAGTFMVADGCYDPLYLTEAGPAAGGTIVTMGYVPELDPAGQDWAARFREHIGHEPGPYSSQSYDAVNVVLEAISATGSTRGDDIAAAIHDADGFDLTDGFGGFLPDGSRFDAPLTALIASGGTFQKLG